MKFVSLVVIPVLSLLGAVAGNTSVYAQALPTASKAAEITAFGGYSATEPDFGDRTYNGYTFGTNFTLFPHLPVDPSIELRFNYAKATADSEHSFLIGPRIQKDIIHDRYHPYVDVLFGSGSISYHPVQFPADPHDSGFNLTFGGGVDINLFHHLSLKLDIQQQNWNLGKNPFFKPQGGNYTLTPSVATVGLTYHFPFRGLSKQTELR